MKSFFLPRLAYFSTEIFLGIVSFTLRLPVEGLFLDNSMVNCLYFDFFSNTEIAGHLVDHISFWIWRNMFDGLVIHFDKGLEF